MPTQIEVPLSQIKPDPANVRKTDLKPSDQFVASIREHGILEPLTVRPYGDGYYAIGGGKRLAALAILLKEKTITPDHLVPCIPRDVVGKEARDIGLTLNYMRDGMHEVDEFEAFADMVKEGMTVEEIGKKYGLKKKEVDQVLALGDLAPEIRQAWREGKIEEEEARAFTLESDQARQTQLFNSLRKSRGLNHWSIKEAICGDERKARAMINFVGLKAYVDAGGSTTQDLFADKGDAATVVTDFKLLTKLFDAKIEAKFKEVKADGWKWVAWSSDLPQDAYYWNAKGKSEVKAEDRSKYGVIFRKQYDGAIEIKYGVKKPEAAATKAKKKAAAAGTAVLSAALAGRLNDQITKATASVLEHDSHLGLIAVCAAVTSGNFEGALGISSHARSTAKFAAQFDLMRKKTAAELHAVLAKVAAESLTIGGSVQDKLPLAKGRDGDRALLEALDAGKLNAALRTGFDAADYFAGVTAQTCKDAIALCDPKYPFTGKEKKSDLAKLAAKLVKESNAGGKAGYLPPEMRTAHYDGPAAAAKAKTVAKKKTKKT